MCRSLASDPRYPPLAEAQTLLCAAANLSIDRQQRVMPWPELARWTADLRAQQAAMIDGIEAQAWRELAAEIGL